VNRPTVPACECGYIFDAVQAQALAIRGTSELQGESLEDQRHYHMHRLTLGWIAIASFALLCLGCLALFVVGHGIMVAPAAASVALLIKGTRMVGKSRRALHGLDGDDPRIPKARLLKR
jgi:hypothetical protein